MCNAQGGKACLPGWGPVGTCLIKIIAPNVDPECPVSTGCLNGGSCFNGSCCCSATFTGKLNTVHLTQKKIRYAHEGRLCEIPINPCAVNPCQNNGLCVPSSAGYQCQCSIYYTGALCDVSLNPCDYSPCRNGGTCRLSGNSTAFTCICALGK